MNALRSLFVLSLLFSLPALGQETVSGNVFSGEDHRPVAKVKVRIGDRSIRTDAKGSFTLPYDKNEHLEISAPGFHDYRRKPSDINDFDNLSIYLVPKPSISGLKVSSEAVGVYEPQFEYIFDYEFIDNMLVVGSYLNENISDPERDLSVQNCALTLFDKGKMIHRLIIPDFPQRIRRSPFDEFFIEGLDYALLIDVENGKLSYEAYDYSKYVVNVLPWTAAFSKSASAVGMIAELPLVIHYLYVPDEEKERTIRVVKNHSYFEETYDDFTMLSRSQRQKAEELSKEFGFDKRLFASYIRVSDQNRRSRMYIDRDLRKPYTPAFNYQGDLFILDAMNQWIYRHDQDGAKLDSVYFPIDLPVEELSLIQQDRVSQKLYAIHQKKGVYYVRKLDPATGSLGTPMKIAFPFPKKLKIYNGNAFYIRHDAQEQIKHLYKEKLKVE